MSAALVVFVAAAALVAWTFVGYPLAIALLAKLRPRRVAASEWHPTVTVCLAVHDGAAHIDAKLDDLLSHDYPAALLDVVVVSDGSRDGTDALLAQRAGARVTALAPTRRRGKSACLADAIVRARGDVLVFTDVRQRFAPGAVRALVAALGDPCVGAAGGELHLRDAGGFAKSQDAYWRYERWIRRNESRSGSVMGVSGALYAVRRADMPLPPPGLVLDDLWVPLKLVQRGLRVVLVGEAIAWDDASRDARIEAARKRRTLAGNWQLIARWPQLLVPGLAPSWWRLASHKWLRLAMPLALLALLGASFALADDGAFFRFALIAQLVAYACALTAIAWPALRRVAPLRYAAAFLELNASAALALPDALRRRDAHLWRATPLERRS